MLLPIWWGKRPTKYCFRWKQLNANSATWNCLYNDKLALPYGPKNVYAFIAGGDDNQYWNLGPCIIAHNLNTAEWDSWTVWIIAESHGDTQILASCQISKKMLTYREAVKCNSFCLYCQSVWPKEICKLILSYFHHCFMLKSNRLLGFTV